MEVQERANLWAAWSKSFLKAKTEPLSESQSRIFINAVMMELSGNGMPPDLLSELRSSFPYKVLDKRSEFVGLLLSEPAKMFLCTLSSNPGTLAMYVYALRYWQMVNDNKEVTVNVMAASLFPMGFLTEKALSGMWDDQKVKIEDRTINLLDTLSGDGLQSIAVSA